MTDDGTDPERVAGSDGPEPPADGDDGDASDRADGSTAGTPDEEPVSEGGPDGSEPGRADPPERTRGAERRTADEAAARGGASPGEAYCSDCGEVIRENAEVCPHCGVRRRSPGGDKNPGVAALLSFVIPGAGQVYNEQIGRGAIAFVGVGVADTLIVLLAVVLTVVLVGPLFLILIPLVHLVVVYDAYDQAQKINRGDVVP